MLLYPHPVPIGHSLTHWYGLHVEPLNPGQHHGGYRENASGKAVFLNMTSVPGIVLRSFRHVLDGVGIQHIELREFCANELKFLQIAHT